MIERIKKEDKEEALKKEEKIKEDDYVPLVVKDGVEVVDVKAVPVHKPPKLDKFGIPVKEDRPTWDKI